MNGCEHARRPGLRAAQHRPSVALTTRPAPASRSTPFGTVIGLEKGVLDDHVLPVLRAHRRAIALRSRIRRCRRRPRPADLPAEADIGLRTFDELNATLSQITGVPQTNARVAGTYDAGQAGAAGDREARRLRSRAADRARAARDPVLQRDGGRQRAARRVLRRRSIASGTGTAVFGAAGAPTSESRPVIDALMNKAVGTAWPPGPRTQIRDELDLERSGIARRYAPGPDQSPGRRSHWRSATRWPYGHESRLRCRARQRRDADSVREMRVMYILKKSPRTLGLDEPIRHGVTRLR